MKECQMDYLQMLANKKSFSRTELFNAMEKCKLELSESSLKANLQKLLNNGQIVRVGRNAYCVADDNIQNYEYEYSTLAQQVAGVVKEKHPCLDFNIMELVQFNEFINHQLAHNVIFVAVEEDLGDFVFDTLKEKYPGKVLINPSAEIYHTYWCDDMIVITKMVSEAPLGKVEKWNARIEKTLVDLLSDDLLRSSIATSEYPTIYEDAFAKYAIDESCLFRYAKRRGAYEKIKQFIIEKTNVKLRLG